MTHLKEGDNAPDFNGLNRIASLQKAYKLGRFGAVPNID